MRPTFLVAASFAVLFPLAVSPQEPPPPTSPTFDEEVDVAEVLLDVLVTDRDGNVIVGLGKDDFEVHEGDRRVALTEVTFYSNRPRLDAAGAQVEAAASERYFILFFHDQRPVATEVAGLLSRQLDAARRAREWLGTLQLDDYVAVVSYGTSLVVHQDFSRDRGDLAKAVEAAVVGAEPKGNWPSRLPPEGEPSLLRHLPRGRELLSATANVHEAFTELGKAARPFVGRKNLVLFSGGFGRLDDFRQYVPDPRYQEPMEHALNDANVAVYAIDLFPPGNYHALAGSLSLLAEQTGGRYYPNVVNFLSPLEAVASEASGYYLLAYQSPHPRGASGFQQVEVKVRNPEFRVKARRGYTFGAG